MMAAAYAAGYTLPAGLSLIRLGDAVTPDHQEARTFCLAVIKEFYGFDYRPDWHGDLDSLTAAPDLNHYCSVHRGAFWTLCHVDGALIATAGVRSLVWKPKIVAAFADRYANADRIASLWRVYVRKDMRRYGLGKFMTQLAERGAAAMGYRRMYLHASSDAAATIAFWRAAGYADIGEYGFSTDFEKALTPEQ